MHRGKRKVFLVRGLDYQGIVRKQLVDGRTQTVDIMLLHQPDLLFGTVFWRLTVIVKYPFDNCCRLRSTWPGFTPSGRAYSMTTQWQKWGWHKSLAPYPNQDNYRVPSQLQSTPQYYQGHCCGCILAQGLPLPNPAPIAPIGFNLESSAPQISCIHLCLRVCLTLELK